MRIKATHITSVLFALVLLSPLLSAALGMRARDVENRDLAPFPAFTIAGAMSSEYGADLGAYLKDRLPFRPQAIRLDSIIDLYVFGDSPSDEVISGRDKWLFLKESLTEPCAEGLAPEELVDFFGTLDSLASERGKTVRIVFSPNKSFLYPEKLSRPGEALSVCAGEKRDRLRELIAIGRLPSSVDLWGPFEEIKAGKADPLFRPLDRHWNDYAAVVLSREVIESLQPGLWDESALRHTPLPGGKPAELPQRFMNLDIPQEYLQWSVERAGVKVVKKEFLLSPKTRRKTSLYTAASTGAPLVKGKALFLHDSFLYRSQESLSRYFEEVHFVHWGQARFQDQLSRLVEEADIIVLEAVEDYAFRPGRVVDKSNEHVMKLIAGAFAGAPR